MSSKKAFALRINPPPPPKPKPVQSQRTPSRPQPKGEVAAKFNLIGTSYYQLSPDNSWALINEVGKGLHWVKQGGKVGYLVIEKIEDGLVVIKDKDRTETLYVPIAEKKSLLGDPEV